uniref:Uncharacterized protein n=1 Tax=Spermophilus dauricus TaxID=99837 RepID=A0A8C9PMX3_SPEDA
MDSSFLWPSEKRQFLLSKIILKLAVLIFFFFLETGFPYVAQAGLELGDPPASASQVSGIAANSQLSFSLLFVPLT